MSTYEHRWHILHKIYEFQSLIGSCGVTPVNIESSYTSEPFKYVKVSKT